MSKFITISMLFFFTYLKKYKGLLVTCLIFATINQVFSMMDPIILRLLIDNYATNASTMAREEFVKGVILLLIGFVGVAFVSRTAKTFQEYYVNAIAQRLGTGMYADGVQHSFSLPFIVFEDRRSGEILLKLQKARDDTKVLIESFITIVFLSVIGMTFVLIYAFFVHWLIGTTYLALIPILGLFTFLISKKLKVAQKRIVKESGELAGTTTETLRNVELVKSLGLQEQEIARLNSVNTRILGLELDKVKMIRTLMFLQGTAINATRAVLMFIMFVLIFNQSISIGEFLSLFIYSFFIFTPLSNFGTFITNYQEAKASNEELDNIIRLPPEKIPENPIEIGTLTSIAIKNMSFQYPTKDKTSLKGINIVINAGQTVAIVGPSGSGKSTLAKLIIGLYQPTRGTISMNNVDTQKINQEKLRKNIGLVAQETQLFAGTIRENLLFIKPSATDEQCIQVMKDAAVDHIMTKGLDTKIGEGGIKISGGERQRLAIARALLREPELFIFDEATSSLDSQTEQSITKTIKNVIKKRPQSMVIMIAHRLSTVIHADKIIVMEQGQIIDEGTHSQLVKKKGLYYALWRQQSQGE